MAQIGTVDWSDVEVRSNSYTKTDDSAYLKFKPGKFKVRLLGKPEFYEQTFIPKSLTGTERDIALISPGEGQDPLIPLGIKPQTKGATNVLLKSDGEPSVLKVMRFGSTVSEHIRDYAIEMKIDPADPKKGVDFLIKVDDPGGNPRQRKYSVTPLGTSPITKEEAKMIREQDGLYDLKELFTPTPVEKINEYIEQYGLVEKTSQTDGSNTKFSDGDSESYGQSDDYNSEDDDEDYAF